MFVACSQCNSYQVKFVMDNAIAFKCFLFDMCGQGNSYLLMFGVVKIIAIHWYLL